MAQGRGARCTPGTIYYGNFEGEGRCKAIYIDHYSLESGQGAYLLAIPADGDGPRDHAMTMIGGDAKKLPEKDFVRLVAVQQMRGYRTFAPKVPFKSWQQEEAVPRLDRLTKLAEQEQKTWPVTETAGAAQFVLSDGNVDATENDDDDSDASIHRDSRAPSRKGGRILGTEDDETESALQKDSRAPLRKGGLRILRTDDLLEESAARLTDQFLRDALGEKKPASRGQAKLTHFYGPGQLDGDALMTAVRGAAKTQSPGTNLFGTGNTSANEEHLAEVLRRVRRNLGKPPTVPRHARGEDEGPGGDDSSPDASSSSSDSSGRRPSKKKKKKVKKEKKRKSKRDESSSSNSSCERGRGAQKLRRYEQLKKKQHRNPISRWTRLEELAKEAGFSGNQKIELYVHETTKLSKSKFLVYLAAGLARIGRAAAKQQSETAAGLSASMLGFLDQVYLNGDVETGWRCTLEPEPIAIQRQPTMTRATGLPDAGPKNLATRLKFSALIPPEILEVTLESAKQWSTWDALHKQTQ